MSRLGFPQRLSHLVLQQVVIRAELAALGRADPRPYAMALYPHPTIDGEWAFVPVIGDEATGPLPTGVLLIDVDRILTEMFAKMQAVLRDEPIPNFDPEFPPQGTPAREPTSVEQPRDPAVSSGEHADKEQVVSFKKRASAKKGK
jgi:hypothetical protein